MERIKIAVFVDVENLTQWIKTGGPERLLSELSSIGQIIVRRAYGKWTNQNLQLFQGEFNRQGFELIHNFHPVSGKNSSDIQLTVDVMEYALRLRDVTWFVLATGDSDFSPLFRRLREMGKDVVGVGPRSPLSESVKTSCSRFIYTDKRVHTNKEVLLSAIDDATDLAEKALRTFDGSALCSTLKGSMTNIDSAFDEKALGFNSFTDFLKSIDSIKLIFDSTSSVWRASFISPDNKTKQKDTEKQETIISTEELYRRFLRKKKWHSIPKSQLLDIYHKIIALEPSAKNDITEAVLQNTDEDITFTDAKKAMSIFMKSRLFIMLEQEEHKERLWKLTAKDDFLRDIDVALLTRLLSAIKENNLDIDMDAFSSVLYGKYDQENLNELLSDANVIMEQLAKQSATPDRYSASKRSLGAS